MKCCRCASLYFFTLFCFTALAQWQDLHGAHEQLPQEHAGDLISNILLKLPSKVNEFFIALTAATKKYPNSNYSSEETTSNFFANGKVGHPLRTTLPYTGLPLQHAVIEWMRAHPKEKVYLCDNVAMQLTHRGIQIDALLQPLGLVCVIADLISDNEKGPMLQDGLLGLSLLGNSSVLLRYPRRLRGVPKSATLTLPEVVIVKFFGSDISFEKPNSSFLPNKTRQRLLVELHTRTTSAFDRDDVTSENSNLMSKAASRGILAVAELMGPVSAQSSPYPQNFSLELAQSVPLVYFNSVYDSAAQSGRNSSFVTGENFSETQRMLESVLLGRVERLQVLNSALEIFAGKQPFIPSKQEMETIKEFLHYFGTKEQSFTHLKEHPAEFLETVLDSTDQDVKEAHRRTGSKKILSGSIGTNYLESEIMSLIDKQFYETPNDPKWIPPNLLGQASDILHESPILKEWEYFVGNKTTNPNDGLLIILFPWLAPINDATIKLQDSIWHELWHLVFAASSLSTVIAQTTGLDFKLRDPSYGNKSPFQPCTSSINLSDTLALHFLCWFVAKNESWPTNFPLDFTSRASNGRYSPPLSWELPDRTRSPFKVNRMIASRLAIGFRYAFGSLFNLFYLRPYISEKKLLAIVDILAQLQDDLNRADSELAASH